MSSYGPDLLSVCIRTYNQKSFVTKAIESVLSQKTSFPFSIIISDDHSNDGTIDILDHYYALFPTKIKLLLGEKNIGGPANLRRLIEASSSKYVVCLDGDDYFTDEYKLQKQVDFLENHQEYSACFHNTVNVNSEGRPISLFNPLDFPPIHDATSFINNKWFIPIHSALLRRQLIFFPEWYDSVINDDYVIHLSVVKHGPYYYCPDIMVAYRHHETNTSSIYKDQLLLDIRLRDILVGFRQIYPDEFKPTFDKRINEYNDEITALEFDIHHPWRKYLSFRTYKKWLKKQLRRLLL